VPTSTCINVETNFWLTISSPSLVQGNLRYFAIEDIALKNVVFTVRRVVDLGSRALFIFHMIDMEENLYIDKEATLNFQISLSTLYANWPPEAYLLSPNLLLPIWKGSTIGLIVLTEQLTRRQAPA